MIGPRLPIVTVVTLAISAVSPMRAQGADDAIEQERRVEVTTFDARSADTAGVVRVPEARAAGRPKSTVLGNHARDARPTEAESRVGCFDGDDLAELAEVIATLGTPVNPFDGCPKLYRRLGDAYAAAGHARRAIKSYEKSVALDPEDDAAQAALAKLWNQEAVSRSSPQSGRRW